MKNNSKEKGLFEIVLPPSAENKLLVNTDKLLDYKEELVYEIEKNIHDLSKEKLDYLKSLLNLEISLFENDDLNGELLQNPLFFYVAKYNLYEGVLRRLKKIDELDPNFINLKLGLPDRNFLEISGRTMMLAFDLLEINMWPGLDDIQDPSININIYESQGFTKELEKSLIDKYRRLGYDNASIEFRLEENRKKREFTKCVANEILKYWNISGFEDDICYGKGYKQKILSYAYISKNNIDIKDDF